MLRSKQMEFINLMKIFLWILTVLSMKCATQFVSSENLQITFPRNFEGSGADPCAGVICGSNAECVSSENGEGACVCIDGCRGSPDIACNPYCSAATIEVDSVVYNFSGAPASQFVYSTQRCPGSDIAKASIACGGVAFDKSTLIVIDCDESVKSLINSLSNETMISEDDFRNVSGSLRVLTSGSNVSDNFESVVDFLELADDRLQEVSSGTWANLVSVAGNLIRNSGDQTIENSSLRLIEAVESFSRKVVIPEGESFVEVETEEIFGKVYRTNFNFTERRRKKRQSNNVNPDQQGFEGEIILTNGGNITEKAVSFVVPTEAFRLAFDADRNYTGQIFAIYYKADNILPSLLNTTKPVSISFGSRISVLLNQNNPVQIKFDNEPYQFGKITDQANPLQAVRTELGCRFWNYSENQWSSAGCCLNQTQFQSVCQCNHLTNFALLVARSTVPNDVTLDIVSDIGCILSIIALALTISIHVLNPERLKSRPTKIFLNVCVNLLTAYIIFLAGIEETKHPLTCTVIAALLQFFFLVTWSWMTVYNFDLYLGLVKVFRDPDDATFLKRSFLLAYSIPLVIMLINVSVTVGYNDTLIPVTTCDKEIMLPTSFYRNDFMCWLRGTSLYVGFLLPVGIMLAANIVFFALILKKFWWTKARIVSTATQLTAKKRIWISFTLFTTMGIAWVFGFFMLISTDPTYSLVLSWMFAIAATTQGLLIFITSCVNQSNAREEWSSILRNVSSNFRKTSSRRGHYDLTYDSSYIYGPSMYFRHELQ